MKYPAWFRDDRHKRDFVAIGTATGVAVAFAAPIGGMLFTVEEGASFYNSDMLWRGFLATCTGVLTMHWLEQLDFDAGDFARARFGTHRDFGLYTDSEADYSKNYWWYFWEVPIFVAMGVCGGLLGAAFVNLNVKITQWRAQYIPVTDRRKRLLEVIAIAGITSTLFFFFMSVSPCKDIPLPLRAGTADSLDDLSNSTFEYGVETRDEIRNDFFKQLYCPDGQYSVYGQLFYNPLATSFKFLLHLGEVGEFGGRQCAPFPDRCVDMVLPLDVLFDDGDVRHRSPDGALRAVARRRGFFRSTLRTRGGAHRRFERKRCEDQLARLRHHRRGGESRRGDENDHFDHRFSHGNDGFDAVDYSAHVDDFHRQGRG